MSQVFEFRKAEAEKIHGALFKMHSVIRDELQPQIFSMLSVLHDLDRYSDTRAELRGYILAIEGLRDHAEVMMADAGKFRTDIIHKTGCDGSCHA